VPLPLLATAAKPRPFGKTGGATGVAYLMVIVQVARRASVAGGTGQVLPVKLNNVLLIPAADSAVIVTGMLPTGPLFLIVTMPVTGPRAAVGVKIRVGAPPTFDSVAPVAEIKANGPADTPVPVRLTGVPVPAADCPVTAAV
jgi:hypothetical protein